jgi:outer membrane lipoprotein SlyB
MRKIVLAATAFSLAVPAVTTPAFADHRRHRSSHYSHCQRSGTTGTIVGGAAGALAGREIDRRGDRLLGTILGAAAGALVGREVERNVIRPRRCR